MCIRDRLGIVPLGLCGLTLFGIDFVCAIPSSVAFVYYATDFVMTTAHFRLMFDLFMIGVCGGIYIVPLYSFIQLKAKACERAQVIAANNILNALFMITSALLAMIVLQLFDWKITELFILLAVGNVLVLTFLCFKEDIFRRSAINFLRRKS